MFKILLFSADSVLDGLLNKSNSQNFVCKAVRESDDLQMTIDNMNPHVLVVVGKNPFLETSLAIIRQLNFKRDEMGLIFMGSEYSIKLDQDCFINGADHYLLQQTPFHLFEPRLTNLCRKIDKIRLAVAHQNLPQIKGPYFPESLVVSSDRKVITYNGKPLQLSPIHHSLILTFLAHADRLLSREDLLKLVWKDQQISSRSIDAQVSKLKKAVPYFERNLVNLYGRGYIYSADKKAAA
jgi:DNA-binding response OmpR family regulator